MSEPTTLEKIALILALSIGGCATVPPAQPAFYDNPGLHMSHDTSVSMNWLAIAGAVTIAFGVAAFMQGQKAASSILAAGITLLAIGIIVTQALAILTEYRQVFLGLLILLGIVAFFVHGRAALDTNRDGKVDWQDLKALFSKAKPKT